MSRYRKSTILLVLALTALSGVLARAMTPAVAAATAVKGTFATPQDLDEGVL